MDLLTPEVFNILIVLNLIVGAGLVSFRFYRDMTRPLATADQLREQFYDERSFDAALDQISDADAAALLNEEPEPSHRDKQP